MQLLLIILCAVTVAALSVMVVAHIRLSRVRLENKKRAETLEINKAAVRKVITAFNTGRAELFKEVVHPDVRSTSRKHPEMNVHTHGRGPADPIIGNKPTIDFEGVMRQISILRTQFPDVHFDEQLLIAEGDYVVLRWEMTGTNTGPIFGRPATGRRISQKSTEFIKFKDGLMVEHSDTPGILRTLDKLGILDEQMLAYLKEKGLRDYDVPPAPSGVP